VIGSITHGLEGKELARIGELVGAGVVAISDDGRPVMDAGLMRRALEYVKIFDIPVISHCEDLNLSRGGMMNEGITSTILGLPGIPPTSEEVMVARDIMLAELTESRIHIAHVSTATSVALIRQAKERGVKVTCETTPHHLILTEESVRGFDTNAKVNPPLRTEADVEALWAGLQDGTIDAIATDHAPHTQAEKELEFGAAPFGIIGLETAFPLLLTELHKRGFELSLLISKMTVNPAKILNLNGKGSLASGYDADLIICDIEEERVIDIEEFESLSRNTPFNGWKVKGTPIMTMVKGEVVMERGGGKDG
jgi:dihydroorotase